jgi:hypothetical protein
MMEYIYVANVIKSLRRRNVTSMELYVSVVSFVYIFRPVVGAPVVPAYDDEPTRGDTQP